MEDPTTLTRAGAPLDDATAAVIAIHGRGGDPGGIVSAVQQFGDDLAILAPAAPGNTWYPQSFLAPVEQNQPHLDEALGRLGRLVDDLDAAGIPTERVVLLGFSQGACLTAEFVLRHPRRYGGIVLWTGGDLTDPSADPASSGDLVGTPAYVSNGDADPHVPVERSDRTIARLQALGAEVTREVFPGRPHTVLPAEVAQAATIVAAARG